MRGESANSAGTQCPLNNLPYGLLATNALEARCGVAIGDMILDIRAAKEAGLIEQADDPVFDLSDWNDVRKLGPQAWGILRALSVTIQPKGSAEHTLYTTNYNEMYDCAPLQVAHYASSGCAMTTCDLLGAGTISGTKKHLRGSLLELG